FTKGRALSFLSVGDAPPSLGSAQNRVVGRSSRSRPPLRNLSGSANVFMSELVAKERKRPMPYRTDRELPESVKNSLPSHAQDIYREAFDRRSTRTRPTATNRSRRSPTRWPGRQ